MDREAFDGNGGLLAVDPANGHLTPLAQGGMFVDPTGVALADASRAFVSDTDAFELNGGLIAVDLATGEQTKVAASTEFHRPLGIACRSDGQLVVAYAQGADEQAPGTVMRVDPATGVHTPIAPGVAFATPFGVAVDAADDVLVVEDEFPGGQGLLHRVDHAGAHSILLAHEPPGTQFFAVTPEPGGAILIAGAPVGPGPAKVFRFQPANGSITVLSAGNRLGSPMGLAVEASGAIIVADPHLGAGIVRVDPATGEASTVAEGGLLRLPTGVAIVP